ncbi:hypothetical protein ThrDRAFT_03091 [Frankia casuarinae]|nr:DUF2231 domain-containing protein [Frankia casuarinae]EYT91247.1 hypothetical protein ThrDRAFT_03091 [Frankia casuarinae]KDA41800.1 hypothetical protein BMG523Draft_03347 [Frankia sp. BMG5.23]ORT96658.1 hypothetical protein UK99_08470 [Frankia casuarinae]
MTIGATVGPTEINGLPAHVLLVHVVVILVPLAAMLVVLSAVWPAARRRLGVITPLVALVALVSVPLTTHAGEWLEARVPSNELVRRHAELGDTLLPWAAGLFVAAAASWVLARRSAATGTETAPARTATGPGRTVLVAVLAVLSLVVAAGSVVQVYRIGDSGAQAVWHGSFSRTPLPGDGPAR